jgi:fucose 4-O-acetylase-like acetyltransferase
VVKGAAILLVMFGHMWRGLHNAGHSPDARFQRIDTAIYLFPLLVSFCLSGPFFSSGLAFPSFLTSRLWPMVL